MSIRVAINGFGRIGRNILRSAWDNPAIEFVHINDLTDDKTLAHLLKHDSVHGTFGPDVTAVEGGIAIGDKVISTSAERSPANLPWADRKVDVVLECTGVFRNKQMAQPHLDAGARYVVISAPGKGEVDGTFVMGVNDHELVPEDVQVISNASCTTNCLAPVAKVLDDNFGIRRGLITTVHSYTMDQRLLDSPHADLRRARSAALNMVPTTTGAAKAVGLVLPSLNGKLDGMAIRVPTPNVSLVDLVVELEKDATVEAVNAAFRAAAAGPMKGVLQASDAPLVSTDLVGNSHSSIVDLPLTAVKGGNLFKILSWYDNEWGFSCRMIDLTCKLFGK